MMTTSTTEGALCSMPRGLEVAQALLLQAHLDAGDHLVEHDLIAAEFDADKHHALPGSRTRAAPAHRSFAASIEPRLDDLLDDRSGVAVMYLRGCHGSPSFLV